MKRLISCVLSLAMMISVFSITGINTSAASEVESIEFNPIEPIVLIENEKLDIGYDYYYDENEIEHEVLVSKYDYKHDYLYVVGNSITVNYTDGTSDVFTYTEFWDDDGLSGWYDWVNSKGEIVDVYFRDDQGYENQWSVGTNYATVYCLDAEATFPVTIVESPVDSVSFNSEESIKVIKDIDGEYHEYGDYFEYDYLNALIGCSLNIVYKDGTEEELFIDGWSGSSGARYRISLSEAENEDEEYVGYLYDTQAIESWGLGTNYTTISYLGASVQVSVSVIENPVESFSYTPARSMNWVENNEIYGSYYDDRFVYEFNAEYGDTITVKYTDGTEENFVFGYSYNSDGEAYISSAGNEISTEDISFSDNQDYDNQWVSGNTYEIVVSYAGKESMIPVKIVTVASYSFTPAEPIVLYEGYYPDNIDVMEDGNVFTINFTDGSKTDYTYGYCDKKGFWGWFDEAGGQLSGSLYAESPDIAEWGVGKHTATLVYWDYYNENEYRTDIDVSVIENPIKSISINLSEPIEYVEGYNCYTDTDSNGETYNKYSPNVYDIPEGSTVTVNYKDGTNEVYTSYVVWDEEILQYCAGFKTETGKMLNAWGICDNEEDEHWTVGENYFIFSVYGVSTEVPVTLKENPVESFYINFENDIVYEENTNGWVETDWIYDEELEDYYEVEYYQYNIWGEEKTGLELIVNYTNGTTDTYICTVYEDEGYSSWENASGDSIDVEFQNYQSYENQWGIGTHYFTVQCLGHILEVPVKIVSAGSCTHADSEWVIDKAATCTEAGSRHKECTSCGEVLETETIKKTGHSYSTEWTIDVAPTCTAEGSKSHHCTVCGDKTDITVIVATGHNYVWKYDYNNLVKTGTCSACGDVSVESFATTDIFTFTLNSDGLGYTISGCVNDYSGDLVIPDEYNNLPITAISTDAFRDCTTITSVVIPDSVTNIGGSAFRNCTSLKTIYFPNNITSIPGAVCFGCTNLESVNIPAEVTNIGGYAFGNCKSLVKVVVPDSTTVIGSTAFTSCDSLVLFCNKNTAAHTYAVDNSIPYVLFGDSIKIDSKTGFICTDIECGSLDDILSGTESIAFTMDTDFVGTGIVISVHNDNVFVGDFTLVVNGDTNGDSVCDALDAAQVTLVSNGHKTIGGAYKMAADSNSDDVVDIDDYQAIINHVVA